MPSQYDTPGAADAPANDASAHAAPGHGPSAAGNPTAGTPAGGSLSDAPGAAADPAATRHRSLVTVDNRLFLGADAVTLSTPDGFATVRFAEVTDVLAHPDGGRVLTGPDGTVVAVEPTLYAMLTPDRIAALDAAVEAAAPDVAVRTLTRAAEDLPRPPRPDATPGLSSRTRTPAPARPRSRARTVGLYLACVAVAASGLLAVHTTVDQLGAAHKHYTVAAMFWVLTAGFVIVARDLRDTAPKDRTHIARWWNMQDHFRR